MSLEFKFELGIVRIRPARFWLEKDNPAVRISLKNALIGLPRSLFRRSNNTRRELRGDLIRERIRAF
jgi:hypothetical protein